jgi:hypothetical protein
MFVYSFDQPGKTMDSYLSQKISIDGKLPEFHDTQMSVRPLQILFLSQV